MEEPTTTKEIQEITFLKGLCVNAAIQEFLKENRAEIIRRARIKLVQMGVPIKDAEEAVGQVDSET